jgi:DNA repair exonuclease SbcCD ATPase subunit
MTPEYNDEYRREIIRGLEQRYEQAKAKHLQAETEAAQAKRECDELEAAHRRAQLPFPPGDTCPVCWVRHGRTSDLRAARHDDPDHYDLMECSAPDCGYSEDRPI